MKKKLLIVLFCLINLSFLFSENWTLAATQFSIEESIFSTDAEKSSLEIISTQLPSLILDSLPLNLNRTVSPEETFERDLYKIKKERQSLYTSLISQIKTRDALIFSYSGMELKKKIESSKNNIESSIKKIEESNESENKLIEKFKSDKKKESKISSVVLYQNDSTKLFDLENSKSKEKVSSSIHGLITGKIIHYGDYVKVESSLTLYPEGKVLATAKEVGLISEVEFIANSIMNQFLSSIINEELVQTDILIYPPEAGENAVIFIEDYVLRGKSISTNFTPGEHSVRVESPGYETVYFSHNYLAGKNKTISVNMKKIENIETYFMIKEKKEKSQYDLSSEIYLNSLYLGNSPISVLISDKTYIGEVVSNTNSDNYSFFILKNGYNSENLNNYKTKENENIVALKVDIPEPKENLSKRIDKSRKRMYWSYGGLILSLPLHYFAKGNYDLCEENSSIVDPGSLQTWKTVSNVTMYTAIGAGVNFLVQLILYLVDANKVVPEIIEPKLINENEVTNLKTVIDETRQKEDEVKLQKEIEQQKKLEEEKLLEEQKLAEESNIENSDQENNSEFKTENSEILNDDSEFLENDNQEIENINSKEGE